jgi:hypothetical protein
MLHRAARGALLPLAAAGVATSAACYRAVPVADPAASPVGRRVVVGLTGMGGDALAAQLGPGVVRAEGTLTAVRGDTLELALIRTERASGGDDLWQRQPVRVPRAYVASLGVRRLDRGRSWLAVAGAVALAIAASGLAGVLPGGLGRGDPGPTLPN